MVGADGLRIGEVARRSGLTVRALRHYDDLGLLVPSERTWSDHRLYSADDLQRLLAIQNLKSIGLSLTEITAALDDPEFDPAAALQDHRRSVDEQIARLQELRARLDRLAEVAGAHDWAELLEVIALSEQLNHSQAHRRISAAIRQHGPQAVPTLAEHLVSEPEPGVREVLSWAVSQHPEAALAALGARIEDPDPDVRRQIAHTLGKLAGSAVVPALQRLFADPDPDVAATAAFALGRTGDDRALQTLIDALGEPAGPTEVIGAAVAGFGTEALPYLLERVSDRDPAVREHAVEILGLIGDPLSADALARASVDDQLPVRFAAVLALGAMPGPQATAAIEAAGGDADSELRLLAERLLRDRT